MHTDGGASGKLRAAVQYRDRHRTSPEHVRWFQHYLRRYLLRGRHPRLVAVQSEGDGPVEVERVMYRNTEESVAQLLHWMGRAAEHESGLHAPGGRRAQSALAAACAGIVAHEVSVMMAKSLQESER